MRNGFRHAAFVTGLWLAVSACDRDKSFASAPAAAADGAVATNASVAASTTAPTTLAAASAAASTARPPSTTTALKKVSSSAKTLDTADWKGSPAGSTLEVRWTVDQTKAKPPVTGGSKDDLTKHTVPLDLTLTISGHPHSVALETDAAAPYANGCPWVSFFYAGMNILFQLERAEGGRVVVTRTTTSESAATKHQQLYVFDVPADVKIAQEIVTLDPTVMSTPKKCAAAGGWSSVDVR